jgi:hypothetical protein
MRIQLHKLRKSMVKQNTFLTIFEVLRSIFAPITDIWQNCGAGATKNKLNQNRRSTGSPHIFKILKFNSETIYIFIIHVFYIKRKVL